jgi:hypothetical protein
MFAGMAVSGISLGAGSQVASQQAASASSHHRQSGQRTPSLTDIDAQGSSVASPPTATGKIGSRVNITA